jgi:hypothetical protein
MKIDNCQLKIHCFYWQLPVALRPDPRLRLDTYARSILPMRENLPDESGSAEQRRTALLGLAFDADDELNRITRGKNFLLAGGSADTHSLMQETAIKINEHLDREGKRLEETSIEELREICRRVRDT